MKPIIEQIKDFYPKADHQTIMEVMHFLGYCHDDIYGNDISFREISGVKFFIQKALVTEAIDDTITRFRRTITPEIKISVTIEGVPIEFKKNGIDVVFV